jgi:hypothetical protein
LKSGAAERKSESIVSRYTFVEYRHTFLTSIPGQTGKPLFGTAYYTVMKFKYGMSKITIK